MKYILYGAVFSLCTISELYSMEKDIINSELTSVKSYARTILVSYQGKLLEKDPTTGEQTERDLPFITVNEKDDVHKKYLLNPYEEIEIPLKNKGDTALTIRPYINKDEQLKPTGAFIEKSAQKIILNFVFEKRDDDTWSDTSFQLRMYPDRWIN